MRIALASLVAGSIAIVGWAGDATSPAPRTGSRSLVLSPAVVRLSGKFGQSTTQELSLTNQTAVAMTFELVAEDIVTRDGQRVFVPAGQLPRSIAATAKFFPSEITIGPGKTESVRMTITVPPATEIRAVGAFFRSIQKINMVGRAGVRLSVGSLQTFTLTENRQIEGAPVGVVAQSETASLSLSKTVQNTGTEPVLPSGILAILDEAGRLVGKTAIEPQRLLPGEKAEFVAEYGGRLRKGIYRALLSLDYDGKALVEDVRVEVQ